VPWVLLAAAVVIVAGSIVVAIGRGGELARAPADIRPLDTHIVTAADVALLRPPAALWGYDMRATDEALNMVARTVTERDVEIATLRRQLADMQSAAARAREGELGRTGDLGRAGDPGVTAPGLRPPAPMHPGADGPMRVPVDTKQWSTWARPGPAAPPEDDDEQPEAAPGNSAPGNSAPGSWRPGNSAPEGSAPEGSAPGSSAPGSSAPESSAPGSSAPESSAPGSGAPGSFAPGSGA
jgi:hypothetical protein